MYVRLQEPLTNFLDGNKNKNSKYKSNNNFAEKKLDT